MAKPQESYPTSATNGERTNGSEDGRVALDEALGEHGEALAAVVDSTDELDDVLTTAIIIAASADNEELEHITDSATNLVDAADGIATDGTASLAAELGDNAEDLSGSLSTVASLQREGHLDDLVTVATAASESLSPTEIEALAAMLEADGGTLVDALDVVLDLQRTGELETLVDTAKTASGLELDEDAVDGANTLLGAVGEADREARPMGLLGALSALRTADARAGLGYLVTLLKALGRRVRTRT